MREGILKARAHGVLAVLEVCAIPVPAEVRERVLTSANLDELDRWIPWRRW